MRRRESEFRAGFVVRVEGQGEGLVGSWFVDAHLVPILLVGVGVGVGVGGVGRCVVCD